MILTQTGAVTGIMQQNVAKVLKRGAELDQLMDRTGELENQVHLYYYCHLLNINVYIIHYYL